MVDGIEMQANPTIGSPEFRLESARRMAADSIAEFLATCAKVDVTTVLGASTVKSYSELMAGTTLARPTRGATRTQAGASTTTVSLEQTTGNSGGQAATVATKRALSGAKLVNALRQSVVIGHGEGRLLLLAEVKGYCDRAKLQSTYQASTLHQGLAPTEANPGTVFGMACRKSARSGIKALCVARGREYGFFTNDSAGLSEDGVEYSRLGALYTATLNPDLTVTVTPGKQSDIQGIDSAIRDLMVAESTAGVQQWRLALVRSLGALSLSGNGYYVPPASVAALEQLQTVWASGFAGQRMFTTRATADSSSEWRQSVIANLQSAMAEIRNEIAGMKAGHGLEGKVRVRLLASLDAATKETTEFAQVFGCEQDVAPILTQASEIRALFVAGDTRETIEQRLWACELD